MQVKDIPEIANLSTPEKILFIEDLWDSIREDQSKIPVPRSHLEELKRRLAKYRANPGSLLTLEELKARVEKRK
jgi:putative addiction module component (TIGR02574 family)